jgi:hypothetical protein
MAAVQALCGTAMWLDAGSVAATGPTADVVAKYLQGTQLVDRDLTSPVPLGQHLEVRRFHLTPNPVTGGAGLRFALSLGATAPVTLGEVAILLYSSLETRVAVVDLRSAGLPARLDTGQSWQTEGTIANVSLVEGEYRLGLFINSSDFVGDINDLVELTVQPRQRPGEPAPYAAAHRGVVELDVQVNA